MTRNSLGSPRPHATPFPTRPALPTLALALALALAFPFQRPAHARDDQSQTPDRVEYNRDVRPILAENCFACHGPDSAARKAGLRLDQRDDALDAGAILPGNPAESEIILRILSEDPDEVMPPPATKKAVTPEQRAVLERWIAQGAEYQPHWSFLPPVRPQVPELQKPEDRDWVRNPVDAFVLDRLRRENLSPAPEADRRALARRAALDVTGLPPEPALLQKFLDDNAPDAYERYLDQLLASPRWGEHRGRFWLDAARYADSHGIHFDNFREMWSYRDWVIDAFNRNLPFDQFALEQLAGDLLPEPTLEQRVATGFNRCNITTNEGGVIAEEYLVLYTRDRTETTAQVFMGLTAGCAVCHDHKFDPLSQREFYSLAAFFNNTTQGAMDGNIKDTPPVIAVPAPEDRNRWNAIPAERAAWEARKTERQAAARAAFDQWLAQGAAGANAADLPDRALALHAPLDSESPESTEVRILRNDSESQTPESNTAAVPTPATSREPGHVGPRALKIEDGQPLPLSDTAADFDKSQPFTVALWVNPGAKPLSGALVARMDEAAAHRGWDLWIEGNKPAVHLIHAWPANALKVVADAPLPANAWSHVAVAYDGSGKAAGVKIHVNGKPVPQRAANDNLTETIRVETPLVLGQRKASSRVLGALLADLRIHADALKTDEIAKLADLARAAWLAAKPADQRSDPETNELYAWWLANRDEPYRETLANLDRLRAEENAIKARGTIAHVMNERAEPAMAYILHRGEYDKRRDAVTPDTPAVFPPFPSEFPRNRLGFARWLFLPEHPLVARVAVNRFWQEIFGRGIVSTAGDFGVSGALPSHPELLDWLALEFRDSGWDVKKLFKLLLTSATYRQSAVATPEKLAADPLNVLLSRGPRFRMDAEMLRDQALFVSGLLVERLGGPSVRPYQPEGVWEAVAMPGSNTRDYVADKGENLYRRGLYTFWKRSAPPASLEILNAPNRETCVVTRERTNTPLQALVTLNDVQYVEAARNLAQRVLLEQWTTDDARLEALYRRALVRSPREDELPVLRELLADLRAHYLEKTGDASLLVAYGESVADPRIPVPELAAWTMVANQVMNLDEFLNK